MIQPTVDEEQGTAEQLDLPLSPRKDPDYWEAKDLRAELDLIPGDEFARAIGVTEQTLTEWRSKGRGPDYHKLGRTVFYRREQIREWIEENLVRATAYEDEVKREAA